MKVIVNHFNNNIVEIGGNNKIQSFVYKELLTFLQKDNETEGVILIS